MTRKFALGYVICYLVIYLSREGVHGSTATKNFGKFVEDLIVATNESTEATETKPGLTIYNVFGVSYVLANIQEKLWEVPVSGIESAIGSEYPNLVDSFMKNYSVSSFIVTPFSNITATNGTGDLKTTLLYSNLTSDVNGTNTVEGMWDGFQTILANNTFGLLENEFIPEELWFRVFEEGRTRGAYLNTLTFNGSWDKPWKSIGEKRFNRDVLVPFMEVETTVAFQETERFQAVSLNLQNRTQRLILLKPRVFMDLITIHRESHEVLDSAGPWKNREMKLQMPSLNITNMARYFQSLIKVGINDTFCRNNVTGNSDNYYSAQPIAQGNRVEFGVDKFSIVSATGALINFQNDEIPIRPFESGESIEDYEESEEEEEEDEPVLNSRDALRRPSGSSGSPQTFASVSICKTPDEIYRRLKKKQTKVPKTGTDSNVVAFDSPFMWLIQDDQIGEVFFGYVTSLCLYDKVTRATSENEDHAWLQDVFKVAFWKCI